MGGENWETRLGRSRAGLLRSPRDLLDLATFGARQSLSNSPPLLALLGTALATLGHIPPKEPWNGQALQVPAVALQARGHGISQYHDNSGAGLRQKVVETRYVQALGVLVVCAARRRSWKPSSPNAAAPNISPPHPTSAARFEELAGKNCPTGTKFPERGKLDFKSSRRKRRQEGLGP